MTVSRHLSPEQQARVREWVRRLRSGEYEQGRGWLHVISLQGEHKYCCLGVACELAEEAGIVASQERSRSYYIELRDVEEHEIRDVKSVIQYVDEAGILPHAVVEWLGLPDDNPAVKVPNKSWEDNLAYLNDSGASFVQIANAIEETYLR
jgi:hypothetical protein